MRVKLLILIFFIAAAITFQYYFNQTSITKLSFNISTTEIKQGEYIKLTIDNVNHHEIRVTTDMSIEIESNPYKINNTIYVYIPIPIEQKEGNYAINIFNRDTLVKKYDIKVISGVFGEQHLTIDPKLLKEASSNKAALEYKEALTKATSYNVKEKLFEDEFLMPVNGKITTSFGLKRYTNNNSTPSRHNGIDIACNLDTPVKAVASGKVVFSDYITSAGNFIIIDHGLGLLTYYAHLNKRIVKELEIVKPGDIIGYVGTTGFSTGPHLHFNITLNKVSINPRLFIKNVNLD